MSRAPRDLVAEVEDSASLPGGSDERFAGYGVMGLPFRSGHVLAMRRFPASSVGPGYRSVWHRTPDGRWTFFQDVAPENACTRYFGAAVADVLPARIEIDWSAPTEFSIAAVGGEHRLEWRVALESSLATRLMNGIGSLLPEAWWHSEALMSSMGVVAGSMLRAGQVRLAGRAPNGQRFIANPMRIWLIAASTASLDGTSLGDPGRAATQGRLGDFLIPQRGVFAIGRAFFSAEATAATEHPPAATVPPRRR